MAFFYNTLNRINQTKYIGNMSHGHYSCLLGYELIKFAGRHDNLFTRIISAPGVWLQHLTVFEPDDGMIEVAIEAMKLVIPEEKGTDEW